MDINFQYKGVSLGSFVCLTGDCIFKCWSQAKILELNEAELVEQSQTYKKIDFTGSKFICQNYLREMHCNDARSFFKLKTQMMPTVQMNFMRNPEFAKNLWTCQGCGVQDMRTYEPIVTVMPQQPSGLAERYISRRDTLYQSSLPKIGVWVSPSPELSRWGMLRYHQLSNGSKGDLCTWPAQVLE